MKIKFLQLLQSIQNDVCYPQIGWDIRRKMHALTAVLSDIESKGRAHPRFAWAASLQLNKAGIVPSKTPVSVMSANGFSILSILTRLQADCDFAWLRADHKHDVNRIVGALREAMSKSEFHAIRSWLEDVDQIPAITRIADLATSTDRTSTEQSLEAYAVMSLDQLLIERSRLKTNQYADEVMNNQSGAEFYKNRVRVVEHFYELRSAETHQGA